MLTYIHIAPLYRVMVNVIELLPHNLFAPHQFGMGSFLPVTLPLKNVSLARCLNSRKDTT
ncbi:hypothetical protein BKM20_29370 [Pseudomonas avellanae]|uniref:Uncharacterized protein n=1 Tax=Pseudomonas avellanae pv. morsprunorum TaxID=3380385 RepID=A0ABX4YPB5_9PSED|nr:hypothetical protein BKM26_29185 [Pseudomonas avellanae]POC97598.1 hypothetical protein BKM20_29370 [Pseudomonas avellanae]SPF19666.1 hypothetical protein PSCFBP3800_04210 [Pseudomonas syringae group genomosp. 3]